MNGVQVSCAARAILFIGRRRVQKKRAAKIKGHIINLQSDTKTKNVKTKTEGQDI